MTAAAPRLLLVDDDEGVLASVGGFLGRAGFEVVAESDGAAGLAAFARQRPDVVVLDVQMPGLDERAVLRRLRREDAWVPVLMLTRVGESGERAMALDEGADDYLNKPFDPVELVARVRAVLRRTGGDRPLSADRGRLVAGELTVDRVAHRAFLAGRELAVTPKAGALLDYLVSRPGELHPRERLLEVLWGFAHPVGTRAVDNRVAELRRALGDDASAPTWIETGPGGYRFLPEVRS